MIAVALFLICVLGAVGCVLADRTEIGAGLAAAVKGRPYIPTTEEP